MVGKFSAILGATLYKQKVPKVYEPEAAIQIAKACVKQMIDGNVPIPESIEVEYKGLRYIFDANMLAFSHKK